MATNTSKLGLYKVDPATDGNDTFNVGTMMNENWDKIDNKVKTIDEKLDGIADGANNYAHPETHEASMIHVKDEGNRFNGESVEEVLGEVGASLADIANEQGDLTSLQTTEKTNLVGALNEVFQDADNGKNDIYNAIIGKGSTPTSQNYSDLINAISNISTGKKVQVVR